MLDRSFVVVMIFGLDNQHGDTLVVDVVYDTVVSGDMARQSDVVAADQSLGMADACAGMLHNVEKHFGGLLE